MRRIIFIVLIFVFSFCTSSVFCESKKQRIISLTPAITEILFALGLDDEIIGVTTFCDYPPRVKNKEKIGTFSQPNIEKILSLKPDIVFATGLEQASVVEDLKKLKLNVYVSDSSSINKLLSTINEIGILTNHKRQAQDLTKRMRSRIEKVKNKVKNAALPRKPKVFVEIWHAPLMTAGRGTFIDEIITLAGGINIAYDTPRSYSYFSAEQVIKRNPDCIILAYMDKEANSKAIARRLGWSQIEAVKNERVVNDISPDLFLRPGPRIVEGLEEIHKRLYAE